jgi:hypothetical protein
MTARYYLRKSGLLKNPTRKRDQLHAALANELRKPWWTYG